jgi:hypothetical protein
MYMHTHYIIIVADVYLCKIKTQLRLVASMTALLEVFFFLTTGISVLKTTGILVYNDYAGAVGIGKGLFRVGAACLDHNIIP